MSYSAVQGKQPLVSLSTTFYSRSGRGTESVEGRLFAMMAAHALGLLWTRSCLSLVFVFVAASGSKNGMCIAFRMVSEEVLWIYIFKFKRKCWQNDYVAIASHISVSQLLSANQYRRSRMRMHCAGSVLAVDSYSWESHHHILCNVMAYQNDIHFDVQGIYDGMFIFWKQSITSFINRTVMNTQ